MSPYPLPLDLHKRSVLQAGLEEKPIEGRTSFGWIPAGAEE